MTKQTYFYKIEDTETLAKIDAFMDKRDAFYEQVLCTRQISQNPYPIRILPS